VLSNFEHTVLKGRSTWGVVEKVIVYYFKNRNNRNKQKNIVIDSLKKRAE